MVSTYSLARVFRRNKDYYYIYNHRVLAVLALMFARFLTDSAVVSTLMWYFTLNKAHLVKSANLSNLQGSLSSLLVIMMANISDLVVGRFRTLFFCNTAYIGGLILLWLFNPYDVEWLVVFALILLAVGKSGANLLHSTLIDLVNSLDDSQDRTIERSLARAAFWERIANVAGSIVAVSLVTQDALGPGHPSWRVSFLICIITMTIGFLIFFIGFCFYHQDELTERPVILVLRIVRDEIEKLGKFMISCGYSRQDGSKTNHTTEEENKRNEEKVLGKSLLRMVPMWFTYFVVSLISATGSTFFLEQYNNLHTVNTLPIQIYPLVQRLSCFAIPYLFHWIPGFGKTNKLEIGVGMFFSIICCVFAWQLEVNRLRLVNLLSDQDDDTSLSFLWLIPQFSVLGCMEGLIEEGLLEFFKSQIYDERVKNYGEDYMEFMSGLGKLSNIIVVLIFQGGGGWFRHTINDSRLDKYYKCLIYVCSANFIFYCCIAKYFYKNVEQNQAEANNDLQQELQLFDNDEQEQRPSDEDSQQDQ